MTPASTPTRKVVFLDEATVGWLRAATQAAAQRVQMLFLSAKPNLPADWTPAMLPCQDGPGESSLPPRRIRLITASFSRDILDSYAGVLVLDGGESNTAWLVKTTMLTFNLCQFETLRSTSATEARQKTSGAPARRRSSRYVALGTHERRCQFPTVACTQGLRHRRHAHFAGVLALRGDPTHPTCKAALMLQSRKETEQNATFASTLLTAHAPTGIRRLPDPTPPACQEISCRNLPARQTSWSSALASTIPASAYSPPSRPSQTASKPVLSPTFRAAAIRLTPRLGRKTSTNRLYQDPANQAALVYDRPWVAACKPAEICHPESKNSNALLRSTSLRSDPSSALIRLILEEEISCFCYQNDCPLSANFTHAGGSIGSNDAYNIVYPNADDGNARVVVTRHQDPTVMAHIILLLKIRRLDTIVA
ncbi:hypothetical protein M409DRAFT_57529 [Zasmidium cellare ATCC 36951]|uniref:Uncharacterized protein n=1 Tax=Zasmidium cellare ATCC 36951 TaxID=1080233 RepID=A0A6A6C7R9_ZASCE|nr:uncharacterized protein M409DRAFT_57529 [Zasmidium cellare ATCC 36951]KAF2163227.1 hypothetical protein M409DRAFT_57529 [Zasmidium cellare ATCC 36951]